MSALLTAILAIDGTEVLGYTASALVVLSLTMRSILRLRIISLCGSVTFLTYGLLIDSTPIVITNVCIAGINVWFLRKEFLLAGAGSSDLGVTIVRPDSLYLRDFIEYHRNDIANFQPDFSMPQGDDVVSMVLTREGLPAGLVIGHRDPADSDALVIDLDYVRREHRDSRIGKWLFGSGSGVWRELGVRRVRADAVTDHHDRYLRGAGFQRVDDGASTQFELTL